MLASLAAEGAAHRDIKPGNLFELDGQWVVGDFGLVRARRRVGAGEAAGAEDGRVIQFLAGAPKLTARYMSITYLDLAG